jgi:hypothetical protein
MVIAETLTEILRRRDLRAARELLDGLVPDVRARERARVRWPKTEANAAPVFGATGFVELDLVADGSACARLVRTIGTLLEAGLPAVFVYAYDEPWAIAARVQSLLPGYDLIEDAWAFHVTPGRSGWAPHRGVSHVVLDRERPEIVNVWVALSDASIDRSCMHAVALDDDPGYPDRLESIAIAKPRALPVRAGTALAWNANVLHWGGPCEATAPGPRTSCTFTAVRAVRERDTGLNVRRVSPGSLSFASRMDLVAAQIATYGEGQPDVSPAILEWGRAASALRAISRP